MKAVLPSLYHIGTWPRNPRVVSSFLLGAALCLYNISGYFRFSNAIGSSVQIFEAYIIAGSSATSFLALFLGSLLLISDAPFVTPSSRYEIVRMGRKNWLSSQILYIVLSCALYSLVMLCVCVIYSLACGRVTVSNLWSPAISMLAEKQPIFAVNKFRISFSYPGYIHAVSPFLAVLLTLFFSTAYSSVLGMCIMFFNLLSNQNWGWIPAAVLHILGYVVYANGGYSFVPVKFSLFSCALPAYLFEPAFDMSPLYSLTVFVVLFVIFNILCKKTVARTEILS